MPPFFPSFLRLVLLLSFTLQFAWSDVAYSEEKIRKLAQDPKWLQLLYFYDGESEIRDSSFFLASDGRIDPYRELLATIKSYHEPFERYKDPNDHPRCRFPARYYWLHKSLDLPQYVIVDPHCSYLRKSLRKTPVESISLVFVTGYLGNPASSFGHSFIKLNTRENASNDLFDLAISYGADVPENENIFFYIYRGLFGRYDARFTDKYFYANDLVYSSLEQRDMWEYRLKLSKEQLLFFRLHLWELLHKKFQYYFLNQNCGYEVARALEVALDNSLHVSHRVWYLPIEAVYALEEEGLVADVVYHPSAKKVLYKKYSLLTKAQRQKLEEVIAKDFDLDVLQSCAQQDRSEILNFLLAYYDYLWLKNADRQRVKRLKYEAMKKRILLPPSREVHVKYNEKPPHRIGKPSVFGVAYAYESLHKEGLYVSYTPYSWETDNDRLEILHTTFAKSKKSAYLREFRLIGIEKYSKYAIEQLMEKSFSWRIAAGYQSKLLYKNDVYVDLALGKSYDMARWATIALLGNASLHSKKGHVLVSPELQAIFSFGDLLIKARYNRQIAPGEGVSFDQTAIDAEFLLSRNVSIRFDWESMQSRSSFWGGVYLRF